MMSFTVCLPDRYRPLNRTLRRLSFILVAWSSVVTTAQAGDGASGPIAALPPPDDATGSDMPRPLSLLDSGRYKTIFRLQVEGDWQAADSLIGRLDDNRLLGHVLAQRYLHPTKYKSSYAELRDWMAKYADLPEAGSIYRLALSRQPKDERPPVAPMASVDRVGNPDSGRDPGSMNWVSALACWRVHYLSEAARQFELATEDPDASDWAKSAAAYWTARSFLRNRQPQHVSEWLRQAAQYPRTFYGQIARRALGMDPGLSWKVAPADPDAMAQLLGTRGGARALALMQVGMTELAEDELHALIGGDDGATLAPAILAVAQRGRLPSVAIRLGVALEGKPGVRLDAAMYPVPSWRPAGGFTVEPALLYALMRQESAFDPRAQSPAGAAGLMQLMPTTAQAVAALDQESGTLIDPEKLALFDPELNLTLAQRYVATLLKDPNVKGDMFMLALAYNAGPGNLAKWRAERDYDKDPLLFIESIPSKETRRYIERVLTNYWIYQAQLKEPSPTLDALATGAWPMYSRPKQPKQGAPALPNVSQD